MNYASDTAEFTKNDEKEKAIREIFQKYINHMIDDNELINQSINLCNSSAPAEKLISVIMTEKEKPLEAPLNHNKLSIQSRRQTRSWNANEDNRLLMAIHKYGNDNWNKIALFVGNGRSRSQCSQRWIRVLDPKISKNHWTEEEEALLIDLVKKFGNKNWMKVSLCMGNRSDVQCRYRYKHLLQKQPNTFEEENSASSPPSSEISQNITKSLDFENKFTSEPSLPSSSVSDSKKENSTYPNISTEKVSPSQNFNESVTNQQEKNKTEKKDDVFINSFFKDLFNDNETEYIKDEQCQDFFSCFI